MKRLVYIIEIVFVVASFAAQAQHQYYYRVGDTIRGRDTIYHYQWWSEQWLSDPRYCAAILLHRTAIENSRDCIIVYGCSPFLVCL